jgi:CRP/FNR family transcriptional activator FtrB
VHGAEVSLGRPDALERLARPHPLIDNHMPPPKGVVGKAESERWATQTGRTCGTVLG